MTHDELLAQLEGLWHDSFKAPGYQALRAVVEWHKCEEVTLPDGDWGIICSYCSNNGFYSLYPCHTIQIIEKELE